MTSPVEQQTRESDASISVRVLFFGAARETVGHDEVALTLRAPANAASVFEEILSTYPQLRQRFGRSLLFAVNQEYARGEANDPAMELAFKPVADLTPEDRGLIIERFFPAKHWQIASTTDR